MLGIARGIPGVCSIPEAVGTLEGTVPLSQGHLKGSREDTLNPNPSFADLPRWFPVSSTLGCNTTKQPRFKWDIPHFKLHRMGLNHLAAHPLLSLHTEAQPSPCSMWLKVPGYPRQQQLELSSSLGLKLPGLCWPQEGLEKGGFQVRVQELSPHSNSWQIKHGPNAELRILYPSPDVFLFSF